MTLLKDDDLIRRISGYSGADFDAISYRRAAFERLNYWHCGQEYFQTVHDLLGTSGSSGEHFDLVLPVLPLEKFIHLDHIQTVGCIQQKLSKRHLINFDEARPRLDVETLILTRKDDLLFEPKPNSCLDMFILALNRARKGISSLTVTNIGEIAARPWRRLDMTSLSTLRLDFAAGAEKNYRRLQEQLSSQLSTWLLSARNLKSLTLIQGPLNSWASTVVDFFAILFHNSLTFPMLESVHLQYITTRALMLRHFLEQHRKTLLSLNIDQPYIDAHAWLNLKQEILAGTSTGALGPKVASKVVLTDAVIPGCMTVGAWRRRMRIFP